MSRDTKYDLEKRTYEFAKNIRNEMKNINTTLYNIDDIKQVIRSSGSIGANYIEANEALSHKDFVYRTRVSRKEAKETEYWLNLLQETNNLQNKNELESLKQEAIELRKILSSIIKKSERY